MKGNEDETWRSSRAFTRGRAAWMWTGAGTWIQSTRQWALDVDERTCSLDVNLKEADSLVVDAGETEGMAVVADGTVFTGIAILGSMGAADGGYGLPHGPVFPHA